MIIGNFEIKLGQRKRIDLEIAKLYDHTPLSIPLEVIRGESDGPVLFISAAIHGDEINGVEVIKRLLKQKNLSRINGTLIVAPIVNVFGFNRKVRYLPDRRDLNRCFPGNEKSSLAHRVAHVFMSQVVQKCTHGIDLHTAAVHRSNLPQIRAFLEDEQTQKLAHAFGVPVIINSSLRDGSLREAALEKGIPMLLFEGGEALRHDEKVIKSALRGILAVMRSIEMLSPRKESKKTKPVETFVANSTYWVRAPHSGTLKTLKGLGRRVAAQEVLGEISDVFGENTSKVLASKPGIIIGKTQLPLVNDGDALFHIACFEDIGTVEEEIESFDELIND